MDGAVASWEQTAWVARGGVEEEREGGGREREREVKNKEAELQIIF